MNRPAGIIFLLFFGVLESQVQLLPPFYNFTKVDYSGDSQIWSITQNQKGEMFFANHRYLIRYGDSYWLKYQLPKKSIIRSLFYDNQKLYCGSYKEFGYWQENNSILEYVSLSKSKKLFKENQSDEVWRIFKYKNKIIFQTFSKLICYDLITKEIEKFEFPENVSYAYNVDGEILISSLSGKIYQWINGKVKLKYSIPQLKDNIIHGIKKVNNKLWVFTFKNGVYIYDSNQLTEWKNPLNKQLKIDLIHSIYHHKEHFYIGTANNGFYDYNFKDNTVITISKSKGLNNNSVLCMFKDKEKNLWLGLENGIAYLEINSPIKILRDNDGKLGTIYDLEKSQDYYWLSTNHGIFQFKNQKIETILYSGLAWSSTVINNSLIFGTNDGTYALENKNLKKINSIAGGWKFKKLPFQNKYVQSNYTGIYLYENLNNQWRCKKISNLSKPIRDIYVSIPKYIFALEEQKGIYLIKYSEGFNKLQQFDLLAKSNIQTEDFIYMIELNERPYFLINKTWYEFNFSEDKLIESKNLSQKFSNSTQAFRINNNYFAIISDNALSIIYFNGKKYEIKKINNKYYKGILNQPFTFVKIFNGNLYINTDEGFIQVKNNFKSQFNKIIPNAVLILNDSLIQKNQEIPIERNKFLLHLNSGFYGFNKPQYAYSINENPSKKWVVNQTIDLNALQWGENSIHIYQLIGGELLKVITFPIQISKPWYLKRWFIFFILLFIGSVIYLYVKFKQYKYEQKLKLEQEEIKHKHQLELLKQSEEIEKVQFQYEKKALQIEYEAKTNELAAKALSLSQYSEWESEIKQLIKQTTDESTKKVLQKFINKQNLNSEWDVFEKNINVVHQDFIKRLLNNYPSLTPKDIQLAVLLRMNLSSKEIAPIMAISHRGVEIHRYRLRKKLELNNEENLSKFFINF